MTFTDDLQRANNLFNTRNLSAALVAYDVAQAKAQTNHERMQIQQMKGIAYRLDKQFDNARRALDQAELYATGNDVDTARIHRDLGMVYLDEATLLNGDRLRLQAAERLFLSSRDTLREFDQWIEAAASAGFYGRALFIRGRRRAASQVLRRADAVLAGNNDTYELNNLVWLARCSVSSRIIHAYRAWKLARKTNQPIRWKEYLIILIGGDHLYRFVKKRKGA